MLLKSMIRFLSFQLLFSSDLAESHSTHAWLRHCPAACGKYVHRFLGPFSEFLSLSRNSFWRASSPQDRHFLRGPYFPMLECGKLPQRKSRRECGAHYLCFLLSRLTAPVLLALSSSCFVYFIQFLPPFQS